MEKLLRVPARILQVAVLAAIFQTGCKEDTVIKGNLPPINEVTTDTVTVLTKTVYDDSVLTSASPSSPVIVHGLGTVNDPFFGRTNAGIYLQVVPDKANYTFSANSYTLDSAVLILPYYGISWGDTTGTTPTPNQSFTAYRVTDNLSTDESYYTFTQKAFDKGNPISEPLTVNTFHMKDSVQVFGVNRAPAIRIRLKDAFKNELATAAQNSSDNAAFLSAIKGIYIESTDTTVGAALHYFVLNGGADYIRASVQFFYHDNGTTEEKTAFFNFVTGTTAHYNKITRNYSNAPAKAYINTPLSTDSVVLIQNMPGTVLDVRFPYLSKLPVAVINKAELVITQLSMNKQPAGKYWEPARIFPVGIEPGGASYAVLDREPIGGDNGAPDDFIDGNGKSYTLPNGITVTRYVINIPREVQRAIINRSDNLHLHISGVQRLYGAYSLIAGGSTHSMCKLTLNLSYSKP